MKIVVLVKQVPDSASERVLRSDDNTVDRASATNIISELDQNAIEEALRLREAVGGDITILTMGPDHATESIRKALSMGPDRAVHVLDGGLHGSDALATAKVLAAALSTLEPDVIFAGAEATDASGQVVPHMIAERLGITALTGARKLTVDGTSLTVERLTEEGYEVVSGSTPAIVSVWDSINEPRFPNFKGIMDAKKKPVQVLTLADLGIGADEVGFAGAATAVVAHAKRPARAGGTKVVDEGDGGVKLAEFLASEKFV